MTIATPGPLALESAAVGASTSITATTPAGAQTGWPRRARVPEGRRFRRRVIAACAVLVLASAALAVRMTDVASGYDFLGLIRAVAHDAVHLRWQYATVVIALAGAHYLASALAARAAAGLRVPLIETVLVQLAASTANRVTPAGLGGAAVTVRYFGRRGMPTASAIGAVIALNVLHGAADLTLLSMLIFFGGWIGLSGGAGEVERLGSKLSATLSPLHSMWTLTALAGVAIALVLLRARIAARVRSGCGRFCDPIRELLRRPKAVLTVVGASAATTLMLALAFALSVWMVPGSPAHTSLGPLVIGFMLASAASNAIPTPAGVGATETALVSVLLASAIPIAHAVEVVVIYRLITFWLPPLLGLLATGRLRRAGVL